MYMYGEKLLEALAHRQPPLVRAVWSIKVTSLADLDAGSTFTLSLELKNTLAQFLEAQLAELAGGPRSMNTPTMGYMTGRMVGNAFRPWQNEESRQRWTSRWWYSTRLAELLHNEGLVDQRHFLKWILDRLASSGLEQTVVLLPLVIALLEDIVRSRALSRLLIDALLNKLQLVFRLTDTEGSDRMCQMICIRWPDAIVQPKAWHRYEATLKRLPAMEATVVTATQQAPLWHTYLTRIERRNRAFTIRLKAPEQWTGRLLDALLVPTWRASAMQQWLDRAQKQRTMTVKQLCQWTMTGEDSDDCICMAAALLSKLRQTLAKAEQVELQAILVEFLEQSTADIARLVRFYDQLIQCRVFSYTRYLRRLVVCGTLQYSVSEAFSQRQMAILAALPFKDVQSPVANQRRVLLFGMNSTLDPEEEVIRTLMARLSDKLPYLTASTADSTDGPSAAVDGKGAEEEEESGRLRRTFTPVSAMTEPLVDDAAIDDELQLGLDEDTLSLLQGASRYCQVYITRHWLVPLVKQFVVKEVQIGLDNWRVITSPGSSLLNARQLATIITIMEWVQDSRTLVDLVLWVLDHTDDHLMNVLCIDTLLRHDACVVALQWQGKVFDMVAGKYARLGTKGGNFLMMNGLKRLIHHGYGTIDQVKAKLADPEFTLLVGHWLYGTMHDAND
ncbi:hypothetical protein SYNPS1DRAFT_30664 [Syncephalis pseudoplumigaleata]|uniref:Uncharacterized protein n=1 Tax=Syncephalis pseudoplumigaleata TaxID=1712513 RepID=A0A4V1J125_9FUNG|nr:hypothetical protein SYNPS1DRAFT_30664 [Syncephalis pseudoplumigaleata]|eukprot:RKP23579.1 hypothetical protein SYNPS1DRAFT_30664 [Syncephalis pseudoplumigaleata]